MRRSARARHAARSAADSNTRRLRLPAMVGLALFGCLAEPAPTPCRVNRDCPIDAPWCVRSVCAAELAEQTEAADGRDAAPPLDPCAPPDESRCPDTCAWLTDCVARACSRAVAANPELLDAVAESCLTQCRVDMFVEDELCRLSDGDRCLDAVDGLRSLLGFEICAP